MDSQPNLIDLNTDLSMEPVHPANDIDHQYVNCNGSESISNSNNSNSNDKDEGESTYSIFGAACLSSLSNNNKDPFDMRM